MMYKYQHKRIWEKLIPALMNDFDRFRTSEEVETKDVVEVAGTRIRSKPEL